MTILQVENVSKEFSTRSEPLVVLREVCLRFGVGRKCGRFGPQRVGEEHAFEYRRHAGTAQLGPGVGRRR